MSLAIAGAIVLAPLPALAQDKPAEQPAPSQPAPPAQPDGAPAQPNGTAAQPAATAAPAEAPASAPAANDEKALHSAVENYWHYGKIARYDLAVAEGNKLLSMNADPVKVLQDFEDIAAARKDNLYEWLNRWQNVDAMRDVNKKIMDVLTAGGLARKTDPKFIKENIDRLNVNERAYARGLAGLRQSGELAVPIMIDYLRDPSKSAWDNSIRRALHDMGKLVLNPLCAATEMKDNDTLITIVGVLGDSGYDAAVPYIARVAAAPDAAPALKDAANQALSRLGATSNASVTDLFFDLGEKLYYGQSALTSDTRNPTASIWYWNVEKGLYRVEVPHAIFGDLMAMRASEYSLKAGGTPRGDALSLWLAANYRREVQLPEGQKDATRAENQPDANYYGVTAGPQYLDAALARTLKDRDSAAALKIIISMQQIVGQTNLFGPGQNNAPLIDAMSYPDRLVRFDAAFALANALPQTNFEGQQRVVPLLAEAMSQSGQASVVVAMPTMDAANALIAGLKEGNAYTAVAATSAEGAVSAANALPAVDVIVVSEDLGPPEVEKLLTMAGSNPKLQGAARLIVTKTAASPYEDRKINDKMLSTTQAQDAAGMKTALEDARKRAGSLALTPELATKYALRAGDLLKKLAISRGQVLDLTAAKGAVLAALADPRPEIVKTAGDVLGMTAFKESQPALLAKAVDEKTADDVKISIYHSLANSARFFGNQLDPAQIEQISKIVESAANLEVRSAAAEARGALNLPPDQAKQLIVNQSRV
jgi:hypothetical protein